ncbi:MAG: hypothetical protein QUS13_01530 [Smithella sp.]|nr:hypothetical protein [Smithella sp.]
MPYTFFAGDLTLLCLYVYYVKGRPGFWVLSGGAYHNFLRLGERFHFVRSVKYLPTGAYGECIDVPPEFAEILGSVAQAAGVRLDWHHNEDDCIRTECEKEHPQYVFGLCQPAGWLAVQVGGRTSGGADLF